MLRYDGKSAIGLGISTVEGGNVVRMGEAVRGKLAERKGVQPVGIEIGEINFQPEAVSRATNEAPGGGQAEPATGGLARERRPPSRDASRAARRLQWPGGARPAGQSGRPGGAARAPHRKGAA